MVPQESSVIPEILHRLSARTKAERRRDGHVRGSSMEDLRNAVHLAKDVDSLVETLQGARTLVLPKISIGDDGLTLLIRAFKEGSRRGSSLLHLDLADNGITENGFEALTEALGLGFLSGLEHLNISRNAIGPEGVNKLARVMRTGRHSSLRILDLSYCYMSDNGLVSFSDALQSGNFSTWGLESLDLSGNDFSQRGMVAFTRAAAMGRLSKLRFLNLSHNKLGEQGTMALSSVLKAGHLSALVHLLLSCCDLSDSVISVAQAIGAGSLLNLKALDVSGNHMGDEGIVALAIALRTGRGSRLQHLNLSECSIAGLQVDFIAKAIEAGEVHELRYLDLSHNELDSSEISSPASSLLCFQGSMALLWLIKRGKLTGLQFLDLSECSMADDALVELAKAMEAGHLPELQHFLFKGNDITSKRSIKALVRALESGRLADLQELELGYNSAGEDLTMALASALTVSSAQGPLVETLKQVLFEGQKSLDDATVVDHLMRFWKNKSFRGLEAIKVNEAELKPAEKIFNKYLERQYSNNLPPVVDEETEPPATSKFLFNAVFVCVWLFVFFVSKLAY